MAYYGINFRITAAFVTDGTNEVCEDGLYPYPWTHGVLTHGRGAVVPSYRDRVNTNDRRIAGMNYNAAGSPFQETINLPDGAGDYDVWLAAGDASSVMQCHVILKDGATTLATITGTPSASNNFIDANGVNRSAATWPTYAYGGASAATGARRITMSGTALTVIVATGGSGNIAIAHIGFQKVAADTTAPTLTSPTGTQTGSTTASGTVSTDEANGTLYYLASTNSTETAATVKAASSQTVTATGSQSVSFTGLTASTTYYAHYCHRDAAGNDSTVANSASFTTSAASPTAALSVTLDASVFAGIASVSPLTVLTATMAASVFAGSASSGAVTSLAVTTDAAIFSGSASVAGAASITLPALKNNTGSLWVSQTGATVYVYATTGAHVVTKTGQTTNGSGVMVITDAALSAATQYRVIIVLASGAEGMDKATAA